MITLFGFPNSRSLRVSWLLEELGLDWSYHLVDFNQGGNRAPDFLAVNPCGKVPALRDDELTLTESAAICRYLAEKYGADQLLPQPGTDEAGLHAQWESYIICELEQPLWTLGKHKFALPEDKRIPQMREVATWEFDRAAKIAEGWVPDEGFLVGEQLTVADILLTHTLNWAVSFKQPLPPKLEAYRQRLSSRPALQSARSKEHTG